MKQINFEILVNEHKIIAFDSDRDITQKDIEMFYDSFNHEEYSKVFCTRHKINEDYGSFYDQRLKEEVIWIVEEIQYFNLNKGN